MRVMTGMELLTRFLDNARYESTREPFGPSTQEIFEDYNLQDINPNKIYKVDIYYSDASDDPDEIIKYTEIK